MQLIRLTLKKTIKASVGGYFGGYNDATIDFINLETTWSSSIIEGSKIKLSRS